MEANSVYESDALDGMEKISQGQTYEHLQNHEMMIQTEKERLWILLELYTSLLWENQQQRCEAEVVQGSGI